MKVMKQYKRLICVLCILLTAVAAQPVLADSAYGSVKQQGKKWEVQVSHSDLQNLEVALLVYKQGEDLSSQEPEYIGYIDQARADAEGKLTFDAFVVEPPVEGSVVYDVYIGAAALASPEKLGEITVDAALPGQEPGDMNHDGQITAVDAMIALSASVNGPGEEQLKSGDVNGDDSLTVDDVLLILQVASGERTGF